MIDLGTGEVVATIAAADESDVARALAAAHIRETIKALRALVFESRARRERGLRARTEPAEGGRVGAG